MSGLFLTFEGPEGAGKSTQVELLRHALKASGDDPVVLREPGGTALGEAVRELVLHGGTVAPAAEMYLFMAARAQLLAEVVEPALAAGRTVILDRYHDSTLAYQGGGRGLSVVWPAEFPRPDRTYLLAVPPEVGLGRGGARRDRVESEPLEFHSHVMAAYDQLAAAEPERYVRLDATRPAEELHRRIVDDVRRVASGRVVRSSS